MDDLAEFFAHGGRVAAAARAFGGDDWIDLSTGIAPWAYPHGAIDLGLDRLPEPGELADLETAAARAFGVAEPARVVAVPGTDLALRLLAVILAAERPAVVRPGYAGHAAAWGEARGIAATADPGDADLLVLASPANPDGHVTPADRLRALARRMTVVVDEAYADPAPGLCGEASDRLIVLRSFGKFHGLPGLRLGFVIAGARVVGALRHLLGDWPVSSVAVAIGTAACADRRWADEQAERIETVGTLLDLALADRHVIGHAPLFRLVRTADAHRLFRHLCRHAILTRPFADRPDALRIGLPRDGAALVRLKTALTEYDR
ncbi:aminotransferase class I/II-fold pyridoxal phosphate-dependent enzyme [Sphingomonas sp. 2R-10]|uniref:aminotransferase class I/II-fold pyridoxal phosphate-dependent enzyme n=1 Tax=Sphingomonas sp. 2R-10 TaxID=3045148 RepID=UPI000F790D3A|nr:aminotransferase class I/II-fold pyridoxal phosphate-dependent enzyme [Sphingomonas sp. 2R-10]MDJ0277830.1 aminotransferase class I/II-fold pyridoxal phosphate-dependent enzyme [Sphingomonas sp. 2R-10]